MSQQVLNAFLADVRQISGSFKEKTSSLRGLVEWLRSQVNAPQPFADMNAALARCNNPQDKRLNKYLPAILTLVKNWGVTNAVLPARGLLLNVPMPPSPQLVQIILPVVTTTTVNTTPQVITLQSNPGPSQPLKPSERRIPDDGPGTFTANPKHLISKHWTTLLELCNFAVGGATSFGAAQHVILKEQALRQDPQRMAWMTKAEQAAGAKFHYRQDELKVVFDAIIQAQGAVCTTFALCAAHILTKGVRQKGDVRIEVVGVDENLRTHLFVICGRQGDDLHTISTWGSSYLLVDPWLAAKNANNNYLCFQPGNTDFRVKDPTKLRRFYDNTIADPDQDDRKQAVNVSRLASNQNQRKIEGLTKELAGISPIFKAKRLDLEKQIRDLGGTI